MHLPPHSTCTELRGKQRRLCPGAASGEKLQKCSAIWSLRAADVPPGLRMDGVRPRPEAVGTCASREPGLEAGQGPRDRAHTPVVSAALATHGVMASTCQQQTQQTQRRLRCVHTDGGTAPPSKEVRSLRQMCSTTRVPLGEAVPVWASGSPRSWRALPWVSTTYLQQGRAHSVFSRPCSVLVASPRV